MANDLHISDEGVVVRPKRPSVTELLDSWEPLSDEDAMPEIEDLPPEPFDLDL